LAVGNIVLVILDTLDTRSEIAIIVAPSEVEKVPGESTHPGCGYGKTLPSRIKRLRYQLRRGYYSAR